MEIMISLSALRPSQYRKYVKGWDKGRYAEAFNKASGDKDRNAYRIYIPINRPKIEPLDVPEDISRAVEEQGYVIEDYRAGIATDKTGKRRMRIGRLLGKHKELQKKFNEDKLRAASKQEHVICISRHPYDVAGMSTDRGWTSCMNLVDGSNKHYVFSDVKYGGLIAYLIEKKDIDLKRPVARVLIKPFHNTENGGTIMVADGVYGTNVKGFVKTVQDWLDLHINHRHIAGLYKLDDNAYDDGKDVHVKFDENDQSSIDSVLGFKIVGGYVRLNSSASARNTAIDDDPEILWKMSQVLVRDVHSLIVINPKSAYRFIHERADDIYNGGGAIGKGSAVYNDLLKMVLEYEPDLFSRIKNEITINSQVIQDLLFKHDEKAIQIIDRSYFTPRVVEDIMHLGNRDSRQLMLDHGFVQMSDKSLAEYPALFNNIEKPSLKQFEIAIEHASGDVRKQILYGRSVSMIDYDLAEGIQRTIAGELDYNGTARFTENIISNSSLIDAEQKQKLAASAFQLFEKVGQPLFDMKNSFLVRRVYATCSKADKIRAIRKLCVRNVLEGLSFDSSFYDRDLDPEELAAVIDTNPREMLQIDEHHAASIFQINPHAFKQGLEYLESLDLDRVLLELPRLFITAAAFWRSVYELDKSMADWLRRLLVNSDNLAYDCPAELFMRDDNLHAELVMSYMVRPWVLSTESVVRNPSRLPESVRIAYLKINSADYPETTQQFMINRLQTAIREME